MNGQRSLKHGHARHDPKTKRLTASKTYHAWQGMKERCTNPKVKQYKWYGARGITVCEYWRNDFSAFLADLGECPPGLSLDRINYDGNYEPGNVRWSDKFQQARNRRNNRPIAYNGETLLLSTWAKRLGLRPEALSWRLAKWPIERAMTEPLRYLITAP